MVFQCTLLIWRINQDKSRLLKKLYKEHCLFIFFFSHNPFTPFFFSQLKPNNKQIQTTVRTRTERNKTHLKTPTPFISFFAYLFVCLFAHLFVCLRINNNLKNHCHPPPHPHTHLLRCIAEDRTYKEDQRGVLGAQKPSFITRFTFLLCLRPAHACARRSSALDQSIAATET